ncbi:MAG TPA: ABC transporter ATP-binding protein [Acidimicrobiales bacterium]|nr:ABC transporter ATP-binding protein [Acidimicrobiales bacterium]
MTAPAVTLRGLAKRFGDKVAVDGVALEVPSGCFFGLVGPNGAGKTTTLRMVTGLLRPDAGDILVDGLDVRYEATAVKSRIGVLPEELLLFERLTGAELLTYAGLLRGLAPDLVAHRSAELLGVLGLSDDAGTLVVDYSHGMRKKIALAAALLHGPRVLFLDEPFEAIDPVSSRVIRSVLERAIERGATVVLSSHVMEMVERMCSHVAVMHAGRVVASGPVDGIRRGRSLEDAFVELVGARDLDHGALGWYGPSSG